MSKPSVRFNGAAVAKILSTPEAHKVVNAAAAKVKAAVEAQKIMVGDRPGGPAQVPLPVTLKPGTSDRARCAVRLAHPAGAAVQAKHGVLTKAAASAGLDVRTK